MDIVCTISPATAPHVLRALDNAGATAFRLNLSYVNNLDEVRGFIEEAKKLSVQSCIDTQGRKDRYSISFFTAFDEQVLSRVAEDDRVDMVAISFTQDAEVIKRVKRLGTKAVAKIEDRRGVENKHTIISAADFVMVDRRDLADCYSPEDIPRVCRQVVEKAVELGKPVWIAHDVLASMVEGEHPSAAEIDDIAALIGLGVGGFVLSAETVVGDNPVRCVDLLRKMAGRYGRE